MKILLIGPQGSGKSTQGKMLSDFLQIPYISTGDIFRQIALEDSEMGRRIKQIIESGQLVDDKVTASLLREKINSEDCQNGFILDGYPRNLEQATLVDLNFDKAIYINVPDEAAEERLLKRGRIDDTRESIRKRLALYREKTKPLVEKYKNKGILIEIGGTGRIEKVQDEIKKSL